MRHRVKTWKLARTAQHRKALARNMLGALFLHGRIRTTLPKARVMSPLAQKLISLARVKTLHTWRRGLQLLGGDEPAARRLFTEIGPKYADRPGGYVRILKLPRRRVGDNAETAILELTDLVLEPREAPAPPPARGGKAAGGAPAEKKPVAAAAGAAG
ncbi:MAG: 50S ribosomal protein L17 [Planctomycetales bacterium]|nr:50S ribosomal protein L17 [Planctomycetales bacterium]